MKPGRTSPTRRRPTPAPRASSTSRSAKEPGRSARSPRRTSAATTRRWDASSPRRRATASRPRCRATPSPRRASTTPSGTTARRPPLRGHRRPRRPARWGYLPRVYELAEREHREVRNVAYDALLKGRHLGRPPRARCGSTTSTRPRCSPSPRAAKRPPAGRDGDDPPPLRASAAPSASRLMESPDREVRLFSVRLLWERHRPTALPRAGRRAARREPVGGTERFIDVEALRAFLRRTLCGLPPGAWSAATTTASSANVPASEAKAQRRGRAARLWASATRASRSSSRRCSGVHQLARAGELAACLQALVQLRAATGLALGGSADGFAHDRPLRGGCSPSRATAASSRGGARPTPATRSPSSTSARRSPRAPSTIPAHVRGLAFAGDRLLAACADGRLRAWHLATDNTATARSTSRSTRRLQRRRDRARRRPGRDRGRRRPRAPRVPRGRCGGEGLRALRGAAPRGGGRPDRGPRGGRRRRRGAGGDARHRRRPRIIGPRGAVHALAFTPRDCASSAGDDGVIRVWYLVGAVEFKTRGAGDDGAQRARCTPRLPPAREGRRERRRDRFVSAGAEAKSRRGASTTTANPAPSTASRARSRAVVWTPPRATRARPSRAASSPRRNNAAPGFSVAPDGAVAESPHALGSSFDGLADDLRGQKPPARPP